jgi:hypothetical protein
MIKGTVSRDNPYSIFFIDHILLVSLEVLHGDFKFLRIFAVLFNQKVSLDSSVEKNQNRSRIPLTGLEDVY